MTKKEDRHTVRTSTLQTMQLNELRVKKNMSSMSDSIRYCIKRTLEDESDAIGSRLHFTRSMNQKLDILIEQQRIASAINLFTVTEMMTHLINLLEEDESAEELVAETVRVELYRKAVTGQLLGIVNAIETIQRQQRPILQKAKRQKQKKSNDVK